ncbi:MAG: dihydroorotase [Bacillota bacterium]|nr:dihydroorotase [Bacillota bacterium]
MRCLITGVSVHAPGGIRRGDLVFSDGRLLFDPAAWPECSLPKVSGKDLHLFPGFTDVHVHLREPGFSYKETILSGTRAAARGGFTAVISMPNLTPVPDSPEHLEVQLEKIKQDACIRVVPLGAITVMQKGLELADFKGLAPHVAGFSDDGRGVQDDSLMEEAMKKAKALDRIIVAHCEDNSLLENGYIHKGEWARKNGHIGIPSESEWKQVERDLKLVEKTGCKYHVCHVSAKESVDLIRDAKARGLDVTCETAPHYLTLDDSKLKDEGRFKMNPPIRSLADQEALIEGLRDGTVDMIATDHAPHAHEEKNKGLKGSLNGVVGLETAFPVLYTELVKTGKAPLETLLSAMTEKPNRRFHIPQEGWTLFDLGEETVIYPERFLSMGKASPFSGMKVYGKCLLTIWGENIAYMDETAFLGGQN